MTALQDACIQHGSEVSIRTSGNRYFRATDRGALGAEASSAGPWERFIVVNHSASNRCLRNNDNISLRSSAHNKYLVAESNGTANANRNSAGAWETFKVIFR
jgi:hypothetical protein